MIKRRSTININGEVYVATSSRRAPGLFSMAKRSAPEKDDEAHIGDADRVLRALAFFQTQNGAGATRVEITSYLREPKIDIVVALNVLRRRGLVICEGIAGYPPSACWKLTDDG